MKNKVLVAMGIGITAALAPMAIGDVEAKAEGLEDVVKENKDDDSYTYYEEGNKDLNNDGNYYDQYDVANDKDGWEQIDESKKITNDESALDNPVHVADVTITDNEKASYEEGYDSANPDGGFNKDVKSDDVKAECDAKAQELTDAGYDVDVNTTTVTDGQSFTNLTEEQKNDKIDELNKTYPTDHIKVEADIDTLNSLATELVGQGYAVTINNGVLEAKKEVSKKFDNADDAQNYLDGLTPEYVDKDKIPDNDALSDLSTEYLAKGYTVTLGGAKLTAFKAAWDGSASGDLEADPKLGDKITDEKGNEYMVVEIIDGEHITLKDADGKKWNATWKSETKPVWVRDDVKTITKDEYDTLTDDEKNKYTPVPGDEIESVVNAGNMNQYNIVALNNLDSTNGGSVHGSLYAGGSYDGSAKIHDNDDSSETYIYDNKSGLGTSEYTKLSNDEVKNTQEYWQKYVKLILEKGGDASFDLSTGAKYEVIDFNGKNSIQIDNEKKLSIYVTDASNVNITIAKMNGILIAPYANVTIGNSNFTGTIIALNVNNIGGAAKAADVDLKPTNWEIRKTTDKYTTTIPVYEDETTRTWEGTSHIDSDTKEFERYIATATKTVTEKRYKITAAPVVRYDISATKISKISYYGEKYIAPAEPPVAPPELPPSGGGGDDTTPTTPAPTAPVLAAAPAAAPAGPAVLGARRGTGAVLGAKRGLDQAVLGARRAPETGDGMAVVGLLASLGSSLTGAGFAARALKKSKKEEDAE